MSTNKLRIIACIPAYNEEENIAKVILQTKKYVDKIIVCDDGSTDMTYEIAKALGVEVVRHEQNRGYGAALATLFKKAREEKADIMITLDGDGQRNPNDIPKLIKPIVDGEADIVIGSRFLEKGHEDVPRYRKIGIAIITKLTGAVSYREVSDAQSGYRVYNKRAIELIKPAEAGMGASTEILLKAHEHGLKIKEVQTKILYGKKHFNTKPNIPWIRCHTFNNKTSFNKTSINVLWNTRYHSTIYSSSILDVDTGNFCKNKTGHNKRHPSGYRRDNGRSNIADNCSNALGNNITTEREVVKNA